MSLNWSRISSRERMHRQGVEDAKGKTPLDVKLPKVRRKLSKAELRAQAAAAFLAWRAVQTAKDQVACPACANCANRCRACRCDEGHSAPPGPMLCCDCTVVIGGAFSPWYLGR
jgi:hypothetical protein